MTTATTLRRGLPSFGAEPLPRSDRREGERWHEAGHAVCAAVLGFEQVWCNLDPSEGDSPCVFYTPPELWAAENRQRREITVNYSGHLGEVLRYGHAVLNGSGRDAEEARALLECYPEGGRVAVSDQALARARETLEKHWASVEWLARMLELHPILGLTMEGDEPVVSVLRGEPMPCERQELARKRAQEHLATIKEEI